MTKYEVATHFVEAVDIPLQYLICADEVGSETEREHVQGYVEFKREPVPKKGYLITTLKAKVHPDWHFEPRQGTQEKAIEYCKKEDPEFFELGTPDEVAQGARTDLDKVTDLILSGHSLRYVAATHPATFVRTHRGLFALREYTRTVVDLDAPPSVILVLGSSGAGKSTFIHRTILAGQRYYVPVPPNADRGASWWDHYDDEDTVWLRDYTGSIPRSTFLDLCDVWVLPVQCKGTCVRIRPKRIVICSNQPPGRWYKYNGPADRQAVIRRVTELYLPAGDYKFETMDPQQWLSQNFDTVF